MTAAISSKREINWDEILRAAGIATLGLAVVAAPFISWWAASAIMIQLGIVGSITQFCLAFAVWCPFMGIIATLHAVLEGIFS